MSYDVEVNEKVRQGAQKKRSEELEGKRKTVHYQIGTAMTCPHTCRSRWARSNVYSRGRLLAALNPSPFSPRVGPTRDLPIRRSLALTSRVPDLSGACRLGLLWDSPFFPCEGWGTCGRCHRWNGVHPPHKDGNAVERWGLTHTNQSRRNSRAGSVPAMRAGLGTRYPGPAYLDFISIADL